MILNKVICKLIHILYVKFCTLFILMRNWMQYITRVHYKYVFSSLPFSVVIDGKLKPYKHYCIFTIYFPICIVTTICKNITIILINNTL